MTLHVSADRLDELLRDIRESGLTTYEYFKLVCQTRWPTIDACFPKLAEAFARHCEGRMSDTMREWLNVRRQYSELDLALMAVRGNA
jgi:hypothetical protein